MSSVSKLPGAVSKMEPDHIEVYDAHDLIKSGDKVCIVLEDQTYYLRITRAGKLILTK